MKKCICYSLWGDKPEYTHGIQKNYDLIKKYLPDWQIVVYYDSSVPSEFVNCNNQIEWILVEDDSYGMFWRFEYINKCDIFLSRDLDSRISEREVYCINKWLDSGFKFLSIRDKIPQHYEWPYMGGMLGIKNGIDDEDLEVMNAYKVHHQYAADQQFLRNHIYPKYKDTTLFLGPKEDSYLKETWSENFIGQGYYENDSFRYNPKTGKGMNKIENDHNVEYYIFNWKATLDNVLYYENKMKECNKNYKVVNIVEDYTYPNWIQLDDSYYFTKQFNTAIENFKGDFYFHIQGDVKTDIDFNEIENKMLEIYNKTNFGVYAPNVDWTFWDQKAIIANSNLEYLKFVRTTDCSFWCIHKDIIEEYKKYAKIMEEHNKFGWAVDLLICALSYVRGRKVLRDYRYTVNHPTSTAYDKTDAEIEMHNLVNHLPKDVGMAYSSMHRNGQYLLKLIS